MLEIMEKGGPIMWLVFALFIMGLMVFLERAFHIHRARIKSMDFLKGIRNIVSRDNIAEAISICEDTPGPVACITRAAILQHDKGEAMIEQAITDAGLIEISRIERRFGVISTIATITPLLGLIGTVIGMIRTLRVIEKGYPLLHPGNVAAEIWPALLSTLAGLIVAVLSYAAYNLLVGKMAYLVLDMERAAAEIITFLSQKAETQKDKSKSGS
ncbi:MAG: MotA/TolQ/ExbB proton channel family protein [Lentisphaerae bacterium]|nr:MotA/TolQ/ExbB proton channel family protein [Lentisphaerota bacterium]